MKYNIRGTYYPIDEKKTRNDYPPLNSHITFFDADSFNYYFSWAQFLFVSKGKYYIVNKKIILNTPDLPGLLNSTEEVVDNDSMLFIIKTENDLPVPMIISTNNNSNEFIINQNELAVHEDMCPDTLFLKIFGEETIPYELKNHAANKFTFTIKLSDLGKIYLKNAEWSIINNKKIISPGGVVFKSH
jgi:hypothetical protein